MGDNYLKTRISLKTGFFRKENYILQVKNDHFKLIPENREKLEIIIDMTEIKSVVLITGFSYEIEIRTGEGKYIGTFLRNENIIEIIQYFRLVLGKKFICN